MRISPDWTAEERRILAALITTECRNAALQGLYPKGAYGNSETAAVVLCAPAWFLERQRHSLERIARDCTLDTLDICWRRIARDIAKMFPATDLRPPEGEHDQT